MSKCKTLQELCLNSIISNFDRYSEAFNSKNRLHGRNLEFLQRKYSDEVLKKLDERKALKDEYLDLVLNKYITELNTKMFNYCSKEILEKKIIEIGDVILIFTASFNMTYEQRKNIIRSLHNVETLNFDVECDDDLMEVIGEHCPKLISLDISDTSVTNQGLKYLYLSNNNEIKKNIQLKYIDLHQTYVNEEGITLLLNNVPSLEIIDHPRIIEVLRSIYNASIAANEKVKKYNLRSLYLNYLYKAADILPIYLEMCPNLKFLSISSLTSMNELILCQKFTYLKEVTLICTKFSESIDMNEFIKLKGNNFRKLKLQCVTLSVKILIKNCPKLEYLSLSNIRYDQVNETNLPSLKYLNKLVFEHHLYDNPATAKSDALLLSLCPNLEILKVYDCKSFCDKINNALLKYCSTLKVIDFSFSSIEISNLEAILLSASSLEQLYLSHCFNISELDYRNLLDLANRRRMNVEIFWGSELSDYSNPDEEISESDMTIYDDYSDYDDEYDDDEYSSFDSEDFFNNF